MLRKIILNRVGTELFERTQFPNELVPVFKWFLAGKKNVNLSQKYIQK